MNFTLNKKNSKLCLIFVTNYLTPPIYYDNKVKYKFIELTVLE